MNCWRRQLKGELEGGELLSAILAFDIGGRAWCKWKTWSRHLGKCGDAKWNEGKEHEEVLVDWANMGECASVSENRGSVEATTQIV